MAAALGIQGDVGGGNAAFKVSLWECTDSKAALIMDLGQGETNGCAQREHHGCERFASSVLPFLDTYLYLSQLLRTQSEPHSAPEAWTK